MLGASYENDDGQIVNHTWVTFNSTAQVQQKFTILPEALFNETVFPDTIFNESQKIILPELLSDNFFDDQANPSVEVSISLHSTDECWEYIGRYFYMLFWLHVTDLGQIGPTPTDNTTYDFSEAENIFVNPTLYQNYLEFVLEPYPTSDRVKWNSKLDPFSAMQPNGRTGFFQSYTCQQRQLKSPVNLIIYVITADYAFLVGGFSLIVFVAGLIQKRRKDGISDGVSIG